MHITGLICGVESKSHFFTKSASLSQTYSYFHFNDPWGLHYQDQLFNIALKFKQVDPSNDNMPVLADGMTYLSPMLHSTAEALFPIQHYSRTP